MISVVKFQFSNLKLACESVWTVVSACDVTCFSEGATVPNLTEGKLRESDDVLKRMKKLWPQYEIDGKRNIWIVKPGDKSKGIGQFKRLCDVTQKMRLV